MAKPKICQLYLLLNNPPYIESYIYASTDEEVEWRKKDDPDKSFQEICKDIIYEDILAEYQDGTNGIVVTDKQLKAMSKKMKKFIKE